MLFGLCALANDEVFTLAKEVYEQTKNPSKYIKDDITMFGNTSFDDAKYIFLPEIHSDAKSLLFQILVMAMEQKNNKDFIVVDESLQSLEKSSWELYTQKTLEVIAANQEKSLGKNYSVKSFENQLQNLTDTFKKSKKNGLKFLENKDIWSMPLFKNMAKEFFGWDNRSTNSLYNRNISMINTLDELKSFPRIFIMLGARHMPDIEYLMARRILCNPNISMEEFFELIRNDKSLINSTGFGSSLPVYDFLRDKKYVTVMDKSFMEKIYRIIDAKKETTGCLNLY